MEWTIFNGDQIFFSWCVFGGIQLPSWSTKTTWWTFVSSTARRIPIGCRTSWTSSPGHCHLSARKVVIVFTFQIAEWHIVYSSSIVCLSVCLSILTIVFWYLVESTILSTQVPHHPVILHPVHSQLWEDRVLITHVLRMSDMPRRCNWYCCRIGRVDRVWWLESYRAQSTIVVPRSNPGVQIILSIIQLNMKS